MGTAERIVFQRNEVDQEYDEVRKRKNLLEQKRNSHCDGLDHWKNQIWAILGAMDHVFLRAEIESRIETVGSDSHHRLDYPVCQSVSLITETQTLDVIRPVYIRFVQTFDSNTFNLISKYSEWDKHSVQNIEKCPERLLTPMQFHVLDAFDLKSISSFLSDFTKGRGKNRM